MSSSGRWSSASSPLCDLADEALADEQLPEKQGFRRFIRHEPVGVVLDIAAWNYPLAIAVNVIVPAVLAGNAVLVKHASQTALVADQFERAFREAGAPEGLVQAMPMDHETTARLIRSRALGYVSFTGSVRGGHEIYRAVASENFIPAGMELGGKDPALVLADANIAFAVENLVDGAFYNAGQSCCGIERIYVEDPVFDEFVEAFVELTRAIYPGRPARRSDDPRPARRCPVRSTSCATRSRPRSTRARRGSSATPTSTCPIARPAISHPRCSTEVDHSMALMHEETFGPAIGIARVANESEGIALMNDSDFGLTASIWSGDLERAARLAEDVEAGTVFANRCDYLDPALAWTGVKDSGFGCSLGKLGFRSVTRPKSYHLREEPSSAST